MRVQLPPIVKQAEGLMRDMELAVSRFPRAHRYTLGSELRQGVMQIARLAHCAWRDIDARIERLDELSEAIRDLKLRLQLAQQINALASFRQFEFLFRKAIELGQQCGGWRKRIIASGQNARTPQTSGQRPQTLSSRDASVEART